MAEIDKSEKITINIGLVDLGQIDLLVSGGSSRPGPQRWTTRSPAAR
jgi:hypothetical protein